MYFTPLVGLRVKHAAMINVLTNQLLGGLCTKPVHLTWNRKHLLTLKESTVLEFKNIN